MLRQQQRCRGDLLQSAVSFRGYLFTTYVVGMSGSRQTFSRVFREPIQQYQNKHFEQTGGYTATWVKFKR